MRLFEYGTDEVGVSAYEIPNGDARLSFELYFVEQYGAASGCDTDCVSDFEHLSQFVMCFGALFLQCNGVELDAKERGVLSPKRENARPWRECSIAIVDCFRFVTPENFSVFPFDELAQGDSFGTLWSRFKRFFEPLSER